VGSCNFFSSSVCEDARPFTEGEVGGDDDRGALLEPADEVKQELAARLSEGQIAEFVEDDEVHAGEMIGEPTLPTVAGLGLEPIDEIDHVVEPAAGAGADARDTARRRGSRVAAHGARARAQSDAYSFCTVLHLEEPAATLRRQVTRRRSSACREEALSSTRSSPR
jgi:hypothetical protein